MTFPASFLSIKYPIHWVRSPERIFSFSHNIFSFFFFSVVLSFPFLYFFLFLVISACLGVINHEMLLANRRGSSDRNASSIFFGLRRTRPLPAPRLFDNCNVKRLSIHSSSSRVKRLRCPSGARDTCLDYSSSHCPLEQTTFLTRCRNETANPPSERETRL